MTLLMLISVVVATARDIATGRILSFTGLVVVVAILGQIHLFATGERTFRFGSVEDTGSVYERALSHVEEPRARRVMV